VAGLSRGINAVNQRPWAVPGTDTTRQRSEWPTTTPVHVAVWADRDPSPHLAIFDPRRLLLGIPVIIPGNTAGSTGVSAKDGRCRPPGVRVSVNRRAASGLVIAPKTEVLAGISGLAEDHFARTTEITDSPIELIQLVQEMAQHYPRCLGQREDAPCPWP
jgi:hypothetical protein